MIKVEIYPRIHVSLINMARDGYRRNGGAGFSIGDPIILISAQISDEFSIIDNRDYGLSENEILRLKNKIESIQKQFDLPSSLKITVKGKAISHSGFGTGTGIRLASIESYFLINDISYDNHELRRISGRGGTSGIGINTYFCGGFIYDVGVKNSKSKTLGPSSFNENSADLPLKIKHLKMPKWEIGICLPNFLSRISGKQEKNFFDKACPISEDQIHEINYHITYGLMPSIIESDFKTFCQSIRNIQKCEWKRKEREIHGENLLRIEDELYELGASAVGMSSLGPCLYFLSTNMDSVFKKVNGFKFDCDFFRTTFINSKRVINDA